MRARIGFCGNHCVPHMFVGAEAVAHRWKDAFAHQGVCRSRRRGGTGGRPASARGRDGPEDRRCRRRTRPRWRDCRPAVEDLYRARHHRRDRTRIRRSTAAYEHATMNVQEALSLAGRVLRSQRWRYTMRFMKPTAVALALAVGGLSAPISSPLTATDPAAAEQRV